MWIRRTRLQSMAMSAYAIKIADTNDFFNQCKGNGKGTTTNPFREARVQVIRADLNTVRAFSL